MTAKMLSARPGDASRGAMALLEWSGEDEDSCEAHTNAHLKKLHKSFRQIQSFKVFCLTRISHPEAGLALITQT
jgi:hypothetical protein